MTGHRLFSRPDLLPFRCNQAADDLGPGEGYAYVLQFGSGMVKVGYTRKPQSRITSHIQTAATHGSVIAAVWLSCPHVDALHTERALIDFCAGLCDVRSGTEYFRGINFAEVVEFAESLQYERQLLTLDLDLSPTATTGDLASILAPGQIVAVRSDDLIHLFRALIGISETVRSVERTEQVA